MYRFCIYNRRVLNPWKKPESYLSSVRKKMCHNMNLDILSLFDKGANTDKKNNK